MELLRRLLRRRPSPSRHPTDRIGGIHRDDARGRDAREDARARETDAMEKFRANARANARDGGVDERARTSKERPRGGVVSVIRRGVVESLGMTSPDWWIGGVYMCTASRRRPTGLWIVGDDGFGVHGGGGDF